MSLNIESLSEVVSADDAASQQSAQDAVNLAANSSAQEPVQQNFVSGTIDSSVLENAMRVPQEAPVAQDVDGEIQADANGEVDTSEQPKQLSPYQKRVQALVAEKNAAREELARERESFRQREATLSAQQASQQSELQRQQVAYQQEQLDILRRREAMEEDAALEPQERARRKFLAEAAELAEQRMSPKLQSQDEVIRQLVAERQQMQQAMQQKQRLDRVAQETGNVLSSQVFNRYDPADVPAVKDKVEEMFMALCAAYGQTPAQMAPQFNDLMKAVTRAEMKAVSRAAGAKVSQSQQMPKVASTSKTNGSSAGAISWPSYADLRANGISSHPEWLRKGRPTLAKRG